MRRSLLILFVLALAGTCSAQGNSPYSELGIGNNYPSTFQSNFAMGGLSATYSSKSFLNPENPASYSKLKYAVGEAGVYNSNNSYKNGSTSALKSTFSLGHFGFGVPLGNFGGLALGLMPFSKMNYNYSTPGITNDNVEIIRKYRGDGNISQVFIGSGVKIKNFSFGANAKYLFGELSQAELLEFLTTDFTNIRVQNVNLVRGWTFNTGVNYDISVNEEHLLSLGSTYELGSKINTKSYQIINNYTVGSVTDDDETIIVEDHINGTELINTEDNKTESKIQLPQTIKGGISFSKRESYFIGLDYQNTLWGQFKFNGSNSGFSTSQKFILGGEIQPNNKAKGRENYWKSIRYRGGISYGTSPIVIGGNQLIEYGIKFGFGFPLSKYKYESDKFGSYLFTSFGYDRVSSKDMSGIVENYFKINFTVVLNDKWFVKRKFD